MNTLTREPPYTAEDLPTLEDGHCYELVNGQLVEKPMGAEAGLVAAKVIFLLQLFVRDHGGGLVFTSDAGYQVFPDDPNRVRKPDVSFICRGRLPNDRAPRGHLRIRPDLVVEVVSPNDLAEEVMARVADYLRAEVRLLWVIYPGARLVQVYRPGAASLATAADELRGEDVLPGFACRVEDLFAGI